jgi:hypothetical protein
VQDVKFRFERTEQSMLNVFNNICFGKQIRCKQQYIMGFQLIQRLFLPGVWTLVVSLQYYFIKIFLWFKYLMKMEYAKKFKLTNRCFLKEKQFGKYRGAQKYFGWLSEVNKMWKCTCFKWIRSNFISNF